MKELTITNCPPTSTCMPQHTSHVLMYPSGRRKPTYPDCHMYNVTCTSQLHTHVYKVSTFYNLCFRIWRTLTEHHLHPVGFSPFFFFKKKKLEEAVIGWREVRWGKLQSQYVQLLKTVIVQGAIRCCHRELSPFCWPMPVVDTAFWGVSHEFRRAHSSDVRALPGRRTQTPNSDHDIFWCKFDFGKCYGASSLPGHWCGITGCHIQSTFHGSSQPNGDLVHCENKRGEPYYGKPIILYNKSTGDRPLDNFAKKYNIEPNCKIKQRREIIKKINIVKNPFYRAAETLAFWISHCQFHRNLVESWHFSLLQYPSSV